MPAQRPVISLPVITMAGLTAAPIMTQERQKMGATISRVFFLPRFCRNGPVTRLPQKAPIGGTAAELNKTPFSFILNTILINLSSNAALGEMN